MPLTRRAARGQRLCNIRESLENERDYSIQEELCRGRKGPAAPPPPPPHGGWGAGGG